MSNSVRMQILEYLSQGPLTLEELSTKIDLKPESIYHHIRILQQVGIVEEFEPIRSGSPGRPYLRFKLTGKSLSVQYPPRNYFMLSDVLFQHLETIFDSMDISERMRSIGKNLGKEIAENLSSSYLLKEWTLDSIKKYYVEDYLKTMGLQPEVTDSDATKLTFRMYNCLFLELAKKHPDTLCEIDLGIDEGLFPSLALNCKSTRRKCMAHGDPYCEYEIMEK